MANITITLDGDEVELRCTAGALRALATKYKTLDAVYEGIRLMDFFIMADVVGAGIGPERLKELGIKANAFTDKVFEAGIVGLQAPLAAYVLMLANGGKNPDAPIMGAEGEAAGNG